MCGGRHVAFITHHFIPTACNLVQVQNSRHVFPTQDKACVMLCASVFWFKSPNGVGRRREVEYVCDGEARAALTGGGEGGERPQHRDPGGDG